ncbi:glutamate 5-kinase, partial [Phakopsora pachyrhizi]
LLFELGTSSIVSEKNLQPRLGLLANLVESCVQLRSNGHRVILVSSGAIGMGMRRMSVLEGTNRSEDPNRWNKKPKALNEKQALAAIGQGHLIALWDSLFSRLNQPISQILLTRGDLADRSRYLNASSTLNTLLNFGVIPIINENDTLSVAEIRFGDNDTLSAVTAGMCNANFLFLMTDVDCLYTENPRKNPGAQKVKKVYDIEQVRKIVSTSTLGSSLGTGGMETKLIAAELATAAGVSTIICNGMKPDRLASILDDIQSNPQPCSSGSLGFIVEPSDEDSKINSEPTRPLYTHFLPQPSPLTNRKFWVAHGLIARGSVVIDRGAYRAISKDSIGGRLLPAGILRVIGNFAVGQAVRVLVRRSDLLEIRGTISSPSMSDEPKPQSSSEDDRDCGSRGSDDYVEVGRGLTNYNSSEMLKLIGLHSSKIEEVLGHIDSENVVESIVLKK